MSTSQIHYNQLLGPVYTWMAGGLESAVDRNRQQLASLGLATWPLGLAVDLGCGSGFQSLPLADAGYRVLSLDLCELLLAELRANSGNRAIRPVCDDLANFPNHLDVAPQLIVCMGDTLTHLPSLESVIQLVRDSARTLASGGRLVLGFRDLATHELIGPQRFIPIRSDADRLFTCFLDYHADHVEVHDLLHIRTNDQWRFTSSSYRKLRISGPQLCRYLIEAGFGLDHHTSEQGLVRIVAQKPADSPP